MLEGDFQRGRYAVQVRLQQLVAKAPGRGLGRPRLACLLVHAQHHTFAFLAQIALGAEVDDVADLFTGAFVKGFDFGDIVSNQVHMLHGQHR